MTGHVTALVIALTISVVAMPPIIGWAVARNMMDVGGGRKRHAGAVPRLGGLAIYLGFLGGAATGLTWHRADPELLSELRPLLGLLAGGTVAFAVGLLDDLLHDAPSGREGLSPRLKLAGQLLAGIIAIASGVVIESFRLPSVGYVKLDPPVSWLLTLLWLTGISNALNFIDGLDGLAGGVSLIMAGTLAVIAMLGPNSAPGEAIIAIALLGAIAGFLRYNFPPARVFMGDGGALLLGFVLAGLAVSGVMKSAAVLAVGPPFIVLALPIINITQVVVGRVIRGRSPMAADNTHLHDRLRDAGWSPHGAVLFIYAICGLFASAALCLMDLADAAAALSMLAAGLLVVVAARRPRDPCPEQPPDQE